MSYLIELLGGASDGCRFRWPLLPPTWKVPEPVGLEESLLAPDPLTATTPTVRTLTYHRTGRRTADGAHLYELERRGRNDPCLSGR